MSCHGCQHSRAIVKSKVRDWIMMLFAGKSEADRRSYYLQNVVGTYEYYKAGKLPLEWLGFLAWKTQVEYDRAFCSPSESGLPDCLPFSSHIPKEILEAIADYELNEADGSLYATVHAMYVAEASA